MKYSYHLTSAIAANCDQLKVYREAVALVQPAPAVVSTLRQKTLLQSALYSARIEGNPLTESSLHTGKQKHQHEVQQLNQAYSWVFSHPKQPLSFKRIQRFHLIIMQSLDSDAGHFRTEQTAIFNQAGVAIYLAPPASEIVSRLNEMIQVVKTSHGPVPAQAALLHYWFEKIHPFVDGNGRVGRLLLTDYLYQHGFGFAGLLAVEKVIETNRQAYYDLLNQNHKDITDFVTFLTTCLVTAAKSMLDALKAPPPITNPGLLPRQAEILAIIKDHPDTSFNFIQRRFLAVPPSTLHYDLKKLLDRQLIVKLGTTRGVRYQSR